MGEPGFPGERGARGHQGLPGQPGLRGPKGESGLPGSVQYPIRFFIKIHIICILKIAVERFFLQF